MELILQNDCDSVLLLSEPGISKGEEPNFERGRPKDPIVGVNGGVKLLNLLRNDGGGPLEHPGKREDNVIS